MKADQTPPPQSPILTHLHHLYVHRKFTGSKCKGMVYPQNSVTHQLIGNNQEKEFALQECVTRFKISSSGRKRACTSHKKVQANRRRLLETYCRILAASLKKIFYDNFFDSLFFLRFSVDSLNEFRSSNCDNQIRLM